jgi:hypothetical protein
MVEYHYPTEWGGNMLELYVKTANVILLMYSVCKRAEKFKI